MKHHGQIVSETMSMRMAPSYASRVRGDRTARARRRVWNKSVLLCSQGASGLWDAVLLLEGPGAL
jgi:hypothetical protein